MTNAFNLLDNMDGLAATLAAIAFVFFAIDAVSTHPNDTVLVLALAGACACAGFLPFNLRPHRQALVFMGDSGSQVLGFTLASLGLLASWNVAESTVATFLLPILILAVPVLDTTLVTVVRLLEGRPISQGGRDHSSHRLVRFGLSEKHAVLLLALIAIALGGDEPRVQRARQPAARGRRRPGDVRAARSVRELPGGRRAANAGRRDGAADVRGALAPPRRGASSISG